MRCDIKKSILKKVIIVSVIVIILVVLAILAFFLFPWIYIFFGVLFTREQVNTDVAKYNDYFGESALVEYAYKLGEDDSIFPDSITTDMDVQDFKMVYYNPWDEEYLSYLVVTYDNEAYEKEIERLQDYESTDYLGIYGVEGFGEEYSLVAMNADDYHGFVYALSDDEDTIVYVEILFCNYYIASDYKKHIPEEYLPIGFDATKENEYRQEQWTPPQR